MKNKFLFALALSAGLVFSNSQLFADASFEVTEIYGGLSGEDGTDDWFEITNVGTMTGDTSTLFYEDDSMDPANGQQLPSFMLAPGESAVILVDSNSAAVTDFNTVWPGVANVGFVGGGGLGQSGDGVFLYDSTDPTANLIESVVFGGAFENLQIGSDGDTQIYATIQFDAAGNAFASTIADGLSVTFFNDNLGAANNTVQLAGNPGSFVAAIPEPTSAFVLSIGLCALARRRR